MTASLRVRNLAKSYGGRRVVDDLTFDVEPGEIFALLGPNGAGKTTTVEICEGFRVPEAGRVEVLGRRPTDPSLRAAVGVMPQASALWSQIRAREALRLFSSFYTDPYDVDEMLGRVGLSPHARTSYRALSGGEKQRLSLALALVGRPQLVFLDEPTVGMDVAARADTWRLIAEVRERGTTVVLTTHLLDEAERVSDRVAIVHHGRLVALGRPRELIASSTRRGLRFHTDRPVDVASLGMPVEGSHPSGYAMDGEPTPSVVSALARSLADQGVLMTDLNTGSRTLEEVFVELTASERDRVEA